VVALLVSILIVVGGIAIAMAAGRRRPIGTPITWGEAFVTAVFVAAIMLVAYGVVPHQWIEYADKDLLWRSDKLLLAVSSEGVVMGQKAKNFTGSGRIIVSYQALRDMIAAGFYIVFLGAQIALWSKWQKRGRVTETPEGEARSRFGRPVITQA